MALLDSGRARGQTGVDAESRAGERAETLRLLAFGLGAEWFALEIPRVRGVEPEADVTPVPGAPEWLVGVFNLRGAILPVVDPYPLLGTPRGEVRDKGLLVVFHWEDGAAALRVDAVDEMYEVAASSVEPPLATSRGAGLIRGQVRVRDRLIGVLDPIALVKALLEKE